MTRFKMEAGKPCINGHLLEERIIYHYPSGKIVCKICRADSQRRYKGKEPTGTLGVWNKFKTHCPQGHEYNNDNTFTKRDGSRGCRICIKGIGQSQRFKKYGIDAECYDQLLLDQNNSCAICLEPFIQTPHVDHCHNSDKVRGLLCTSCNNGLGRFRDSSAFLRRAANYIDKIVE